MTISLLLRNRLGFRPRRRERRPRINTREKRRQRRVPCAPVKLGQPQIEITKCAAGGDIGQAIAAFDQPIACQCRIERGAPGLDFFHLPRHPVLALHTADTFEHQQYHGIAHPVGDRLDLPVCQARTGWRGK